MQYSNYRFGTFEFLKGHAVDERGNLAPIMRMLCGLGAGMLSTNLSPYLHNKNSFAYIKYFLSFLAKVIRFELISPLFDVSLLSYATDF